MSLAIPLRISRLAFGVRAAVINMYLRAKHPERFTLIFGKTKAEADKEAFLRGLSPKQSSLIQPITGFNPKQ